MDWLTINFTLPKEPSRIRVSVWRKLKKIGSVNVGQSFWVLPFTDDSKEKFLEIVHEIKTNKGMVFMTHSKFLLEESEETIINLFNEARNEEYNEILEKCDAFFKEIEKEKQDNFYTFAEIEENEYEMEKLFKWFNEVSHRDYFNSSLKRKTMDTLHKCQEVLEEYSEKVYQLNNNL